MPTAYSGLGQTCLRTAWIFQALAAAPMVVFLGVQSYMHFAFSFETIYDLVASLSTALLASAIIFIVLVQCRIPEDRTTIHLAFRFEVAKTTLATIMWVWLVCDSLFNPLNRYRFYDRPMRVKAAIFTGIVLLVLFYPAVWYTARERKCAQRSVRLEDDSEQTPLLRRLWPTQTREAPRL